jgi:hypothetical protein
MGNPSGATTDVNNPFNYLMYKPQYALSYHRDRAIPNGLRGISTAPGSVRRTGRTITALTRHYRRAGIA